MSLTRPDETAWPAGDDPEGQDTPPAPFYVVGTRKMVVLGLVTLGAYELYWFYRHWARVKAVARDDLWPIPRAVFSVLYSYSLFQRVDEAAQVRGVPNTLVPGLAAGVFTALILSQRLPAPWSLLAMLSVLALVPVQRVVNALPEVQSLPAVQRNERFRAGDWVVVVMGSIVTLLFLLGTLLPDVPAAPASPTVSTLVEDVRRDLPLTLTGGVVLEHLELTREGVGLYVRLVNATGREALATGLVGRVQQTLRELACTSEGFERAALTAGVPLRYTISDRDRTRIATMAITSPSQCAAVP